MWMQSPLRSRWLAPPKLSSISSRRAARPAGRGGAACAVRRAGRALRGAASRRRSRPVSRCLAARRCAAHSRCQGRARPAGRPGARPGRHGAPRGTATTRSRRVPAVSRSSNAAVGLNSPRSIREIIARLTPVRSASTSSVRSRRWRADYRRVARHYFDVSLGRILHFSRENLIYWKMSRPAMLQRSKAPATNPGPVQLHC